MTIRPQPYHDGSATEASRLDGATGPERLSPKEQGVLSLALRKGSGNPVDDLLAASEAPSRQMALPLWLLLVGRDAVHKRWGIVTGAGLVWTAFGLALVIDAFDGALHIPDRWFGLLLVFEAVGSFVRGLVASGAARRLRLLKAVLLLVVAVLTMLASPASTFLLAMLFGAAFLFDGLSRFALSMCCAFRLAPVGGARAVGSRPRHRHAATLAHLVRRHGRVLHRRLPDPEWDQGGDPRAAVAAPSRGAWTKLGSRAALSS